MDFKDLIGAIEDMFKVHGIKEDTIIHIKTENGRYKPIDGFALLHSDGESKIIIE